MLVPPEVKTGGDFDILLLEPATGDRIQYRVQAKRLIPHAKNWQWGSYRELDHPHGTGGQASTLIRSSAHESIPTIPLYAFYNPQSACVESNNAVMGIQLADGREVSAIIRALVKAKAKGKRPRWKRIQYLRHLFFPLSTILCPPVEVASSETKILSPRISRRSVEAAIASRRRSEWEEEDAPPRLRDQPAELPALPPPGSGVENAPSAALRSRREHRELPVIVERALRRRPDASPIQKAPVKRPKLILMSRGSTSEE